MKIAVLILSMYMLLYGEDKKVSNLRNVVGTSYTNTFTMKHMITGTTLWSVITIDSCEYIVSGIPSGASFAITHKGNCIYCEQREKFKMFK